MKVKNTYGGVYQDFIPISEGEVRIYVCGLTVYDRMHIGHLRSFIPFDIIVRYLRFKGFKVIFVRNFTDVDDKIIQRAREEGISAYDVSSKYIDLFRKDIEPFELIKPDFEPRVTEHIPDIIELIKKIIKNGYGYVVDGDVYFDVLSFKDYGKLSGMSLENMLAGARVEPDEKKKNPLDFALWKAKKYQDEPSWNSPWGEGRPGWHIECSAMSMKYLGEEFDIHGGGQDLIFPHHENEIAQSRAATGKGFAKYWLHTGHLTLKGEKMSKSLGNVIDIPQLLKKFHPEVIKFSIAKYHYRSPVEFSDDNIKKDEKALINFYYTLEFETEKAKIREHEIEKMKDDSKVKNLIDSFCKFMDDDFNTPSAFSLVFSAFEDVRKSNSKDELIKFLAFLKKIYEGTGLFGKIPLISQKSFIEEEVIRRCKEHGISYDEVCKLVEKREELRKQKKFQEADEIRKKLLDIGIYLQDTPFGAKKIPHSEFKTE
jgi:cysteinyl-tRNA synthetase